MQFFERFGEMQGVDEALRPQAPRYLGLALIGAGVLGLVISLWQYRRGVNYLWSSDFKAIAGMDEQRMSMPSFAAAVVVLLIGLFAFGAIFLRFCEGSQPPADGPRGVEKWQNQQKQRQTKPNILVMWGDDIGQSNLSCYTKGVMGYHTPNIDRIANEGMIFTDAYAEQSCTAGRASFITGQCGLRTGLTKVGLPGAELGLKAEDITIAEALKPLGYRTGQFGKNHLGDRDEHLPTMHGFDEFFGNLYHLNAEEEPEEVDYPNEKDYPEFKKKYGPRGVLHCWADGNGGQKIENTGPLTKKRMETIDEDFLAAAKKFIKAAHDAGEPFFVWFNTTHMHAWTHVKPESRGQAGRWQSEYHDVMIDHDKHIGEMLDFLDELGIADNTFVQYSTDNGPHMNTWPDGGHDSIP